jgi:hypothetical protein
MRKKYPRTPHLPWSMGATDDDKIMKNISVFESLEVVITEKMDGENTSLYSDGYMHARSLDSINHPSRNWVKNWWSSKFHDLPSGWRICGENLFAKHSIKYENLPSYFMGFSIWKEDDFCLSWKETMEWFEILDITPAPILYSGVFDRKELEKIEKYLDFSNQEGYVVRKECSFHISEFHSSVAKFVRKDHVAENAKHWRHSEIEKNGILRYD